MSNLKIRTELVVDEESNIKVWRKKLRYKRIMHSNCFRGISKDVFHFKKIKTGKSM